MQRGCVRKLGWELWVSLLCTWEALKTLLVGCSSLDSTLKYEQSIPINTCCLSGHFCMPCCSTINASGNTST